MWKKYLVLCGVTCMSIVCKGKCGAQQVYKRKCPPTVTESQNERLIGCIRMHLRACLEYLGSGWECQWAWSAWEVVDGGGFYLGECLEAWLEWVCAWQVEPAVRQRNERYLPEASLPLLIQNRSTILVYIQSTERDTACSSLSVPIPPVAWPHSPYR